METIVACLDVNFQLSFSFVQMFVKRLLQSCLRRECPCEERRDG
jgi:hypothetical protein